MIIVLEVFAFIKLTPQSPLNLFFITIANIEQIDSQRSRKIIAKLKQIHLNIMGVVVK